MSRLTDALVFAALMSDVLPSMAAAQSGIAGVVKRCDRWLRFPG